LFFDEAEGIFGKQGLSSSSDPYLSTFNTLWGNLINDKVQVFIFGATNIPDSLAMGAGISRRFQRMILVDLPDGDARRMVLEYALSSVSHSLTPDEMDRIAFVSEGYTGDDIVKVIEEVEEEQIQLFCKALYWQKVSPLNPSLPTADIEN
jgi:SpoVK/Ycf46/Vps4 family AAA+-type ATPase